MKQVIRKIHDFLLKNNKTIAVAESCTGGIISSSLTELPGSSKYFILGAVTYSNKAKENILKIPHKVIAKNGAVSEAVALLMAKNIRKIAKTDFGIGITGIAGPTGGSSSKPIGTVFIAVSNKNKTICKKFQFTGTRAQIRKKSAIEALNLFLTKSSL
ncbi:MAG: CinA family protein [Candidatus Omnitrophota bacterium]